MDQHKAIKIATEIVELDVKRDELYEQLMLLAGDKGEALLRAVQNGVKFENIPDKK